ncbi:hypothetical protein JOD45_000060 [Scopulibacillus daqui]|uniref:Uncharacterized protein n=1 Tax=Scopulibacillus daqui TaxID=1469162 RepID=A0ABS2PUY5_9BACL|nr:hypothetical protein [Scopulibacillus daqui]MBM7643869.1 hypothetical protein [Scopulibacillus daqui]
MKVHYKVFDSLAAIEEKPNDQDIEFIIETKNEKAFNKLHEVRKFFESDKVLTDVLFYTLGDHSFQVIVRRDSYTAFVLGLFGFQLIKQIEWRE